MIIIAEPILNNVWEHLTLMFAGGTGIGILSHAVDTWPTDGMSPKQLWLLGMIKYFTGHRNSGAIILESAKSLSSSQQLQVPKDN